LFWQHFESKRPEGFFTEQFKELITMMFQHKPYQRLSLVDIISHPWFEGEMASAEQVREEFLRRDQVNK